MGKFKTRLDKFNSFREHPWYGSQFKKLRKSDIEFCVNFINENEKLSSVEVWHLIRDMRCTSDKSADKKRFMICVELLDISRTL